MAKVCPIRVLASGAEISRLVGLGYDRTQEAIAHIVTCIEEKCAWWDEESKECAVATMANCLCGVWSLMKAEELDY